MNAAAWKACRGIGVNEHRHGVRLTRTDITRHVDVNGLQCIEAAHLMEPAPFPGHEPSIHPHPNAAIIVFFVVHAAEGQRERFIRRVSRHLELRSIPGLAPISPSPLVGMALGFPVQCRVDGFPAIPVLGKVPLIDRADIFGVLLEFPGSRQIRDEFTLIAAGLGG